MQLELEHTYLSLMRRIRQRFDVVELLKLSPAGDFSKAELVAFHGRKIVEGIAFACLLATDKGLKSVPRDARGQWNAENIFKRLRSKGIDVFPSPSKIRSCTEVEQKLHGVKAVVEGLPELRITHDEIIKIYQHLHFWNHEINPYIEPNEEVVEKRIAQLWADINRLRQFLKSHFISLQGEGMFCVLYDTVDNQTKVMPFSKLRDI
jgi:hypothetical protein